MFLAAKRPKKPLTADLSAWMTDDETSEDEAAAGMSLKDLCDDNSDDTLEGERMVGSPPMRCSSRHYSRKLFTMDTEDYVLDFHQF